MTAPFADRLAEAVRSKRSSLVVGLDPRLEKLPVSMRESARAAVGDDDPRVVAAAAIARFDAAVIAEVAEFAVAVKPQIAFYEQWGPPGLAAYEHAVREAHAAGLLVIGDIKRGDIGSTAEAYARAHLGGDSADEGGGGSSHADAVTVNPLLGSDSIEPFLRVASASGGGLFVLVRTSNPSAAELQDLLVPDRPLHDVLAELVGRWGNDLIGACGYSSVGAVVGATAPEELGRLRRLMPRAWLLVPGVGAQGATAADVAGAFDREGLGAVVNSSRGILYAYGDPQRTEWRADVRDAARTLRDQLRDAALQAAT
ncbi:MAG: orotidine-5'-phosphate decarboxylase [Planctomycetota bacterium]|jgi:orotidine-5'-phosphate decarboxylase